MQFNNVLYVADGAVATVTINRPKALNALNQETLEEMLRCFRELAQNQAIRVVIVTGGGEKAFVAGADIAFMEKLAPLAARCFAMLGQQVLSTIENLPQPVIAAVNGFALGGGCELALACDIRLASENARFGQPEVNLGVMPGFGGTQRLPRLIGRGRANELLFSGDIIDAQEAARIGLVNRVVPQAKLLAECREMAEKIASRGPVAVRLCKEAVNNGVEMDLAGPACMKRTSLPTVLPAMSRKRGCAHFWRNVPPNFRDDRRKEENMNLDLTEEQKLIQDTARDFAVAELEPVAAELDQERGPAGFFTTTCRNLPNWASWGSISRMNTAARRPVPSPSAWP